MKIEVKERTPGVSVVALAGEVDMSTSPRVREVLLPCFGQGTSHVVVDLSRVSYIDSSGIATLVEGLQLSRRGGIRFTLVGVSSSVDAVFELAYLKDVFEMAPGMDELFQGELPRG